MHHLYIDIETYSPVDLKKCGAYKYIEHPDFEIQLFSYAYNNDPVVCIDLTKQVLPIDLKTDLLNPEVIKHAHNATFERRSLSKYLGREIPISQWECSLVKCAYCGLPLSLDEASEVLDIAHKKLKTGKSLINTFAKPIKPSKSNGFRTRWYPDDLPALWEDYKEYNIFDVEAERDIDKALASFEIPDMEKQLYILDQSINDCGILIDTAFVTNAIHMDNVFSASIIEQMVEDTGMSNPKSNKQLKEYLAKEYGFDIESLNKKEMPELLKRAKGTEVHSILKQRNMVAKSSTKKYVAMLNYANEDNKARGLFQFYGANRTGRWAGRGIQLQNLPQNHLADLALARKLVADNDLDQLEMLFGNVTDVLSQLIRTAFVAPEGCTFAVADFSAIEARVLAWLANETWRLEVFATHGKIYEASAAMMFHMNIEDIKKGSPERFKGKVAELALGYQGSLGAMKNMGGEAMGLSVPEMMHIVRMWRNANKNIVRLWGEVDEASIEAVMYKTPQYCRVGRPEDNLFLVFAVEENYLTIQLPSGRKLFYLEPKLVRNSKGNLIITYSNTDQKTKSWGTAETYGGKFIENITQAIARDLLAWSMLKINKQNFKIVLHVHDEVAVEIPKENAERTLKYLCDLMGESVPWAPGLLLRADGYTTDFYMKD